MKILSISVAELLHTLVGLSIAHVIAEAHVKKLLGLPCLKNIDGPAPLEFSRHLDTADRTLTDMGAEYVSDLNHMNTMREEDGLSVLGRLLGLARGLSFKIL